MVLEQIQIKQHPSEPVLLVDRECEFSRIIVSLSRNDAEWLTSIGWSSTPKSIPLACIRLDDSLAMALPASHATSLNDGDALTIECQELGFEGTLVWDFKNFAAPIPSPSPLPQTASLEHNKPAVISKVTSDLRTKFDTLIANDNIAKLKTSRFALHGAVLAFIVVSGVILMTLRGAPDSKFDLQDDFESLESAVLSSALEDMPVEIEARSVPEPQTEVPVTKQTDKQQAEKTLSARIVTPKVKPENKSREVKPDPNKTVPKPKLKVKSASAKNIPTPSMKPVEVALSKNKVLPASKPSKTVVLSSKAETFDTYEVNAAIQAHLKNMRYFYGDIDGERNIATLQALSMFKDTFGIPADQKIDAALLDRLKLEEENYLNTLSGK